MEVDRRREVRWIAEATSLSLDAHDLAVETLGDTVRDRMLHEAEDAIEMTLQGRRHLLDWLEPRTDGPPIPTGEEPRHRRMLSVRPERP
jgi:hypothetical protein